MPTFRLLESLTRTVPQGDQEERKFFAGEESREMRRWKAEGCRESHKG